MLPAASFSSFTTLNKGRGEATQRERAWAITGRGGLRYSGRAPTGHHRPGGLHYSARARMGQHRPRRRHRAEPPVLVPHQAPAFFMHHPVVRPAEQRQVGQRRRAAARPPDQVMPVAPDGRPRATREDAVPVACFERPPRRRRQRPAGVVELVLELALAGNPADGTVAGIALDGLRRYRAATLDLTRRRAPGPGQGVEAGADDQLRARACAIALAAGAPLPAELNQGVGATLTVAARVVFDRLHERLQRGA